MDSEKLFDEANSCSENNQGGDPFGDGKSISDFTGTMPWITLVPSTSSSSEKKNSDGLTKWKKVRRACEPCRSMKLRCDEKRPCSRCVRNKRVSKCIDRSQSEIRRNSYRSNASKNSSVRIRHDNLLIRHCNSSMVFDEASINFDCFNEEENFYWLNNPLLSSHAFLSSASTSADTIDVIKLVKSYGPDRIHNILIDKAGMCKMLWYWFRNFFGQEFALRLRDEMYKDALTVATELSESILREQISKLSPEIPLIPIKWVHSVSINFLSYEKLFSHSLL